MKKILISIVAVALFCFSYLFITYLDLHLMIFSKILATLTISSFILFRVNKVKLVKQRAD
ncbi:MAG: hypothetical protein M3Q58_00285 [Bacteroidota bacterium]|nr:hypothetical protein [Bacteroidota bacterium]